MKIGSKEKFENVKKIYQSHNDSQSSSSSQITKKEDAYSEVILKFNFPNFSDYDSISFDFKSINLACPIYKKRLTNSIGNSNGFQLEKEIKIDLPLWIIPNDLMDYFFLWKNGIDESPEKISSTILKISEYFENFQFSDNLVTKIYLNLVDASNCLQLLEIVYEKMTISTENKIEVNPMWLELFYKLIEVSATNFLSFLENESAISKIKNFNKKVLEELMDKTFSHLIMNDYKILDLNSSNLLNFNSINLNEKVIFMQQMDGLINFLNGTRRVDNIYDLLIHEYLRISSTENTNELANIPHPTFQIEIPVDISNYYYEYSVDLGLNKQIVFAIYYKKSDDSFNVNFKLNEINQNKNIGGKNSNAEKNSNSDTNQSSLLSSIFSKYSNKFDSVLEKFKNLKNSENNRGEKQSNTNFNLNVDNQLINVSNSLNSFFDIFTFLSVASINSSEGKLIKRQVNVKSISSNKSVHTIFKYSNFKQLLKRFFTASIKRESSLDCCNQSNNSHQNNNNDYMLINQNINTWAYDYDNSLNYNKNRGNGQTDSLKLQSNSQGQRNNSETNESSPLPQKFILTINLKLCFVHSAISSYLLRKFPENFDHPKINKISKQLLQILLKHKNLKKTSEDQIVIALLNWLDDEININEDIADIVENINWKSVSLDVLIEFICKHHKIIEDYELEKVLIHSVCGEGNVDMNIMQIDLEKKKNFSHIHVDDKGKVNDKNLSMKYSEDTLMKTFLINIMKASKRISYTKLYQENKKLAKLKILNPVKEQILTSTPSQSQFQSHSPLPTQSHSQSQNKVNSTYKKNYLINQGDLKVSTENLNLNNLNNIPDFSNSSSNFSKRQRERDKIVPLPIHVIPTNSNKDSFSNLKESFDTNKKLEITNKIFVPELTKSQNFSINITPITQNKNLETSSTKNVKNNEKTKFSKDHSQSINKSSSKSKSKKINPINLKTQTNFNIAKHQRFNSKDIISGSSAIKINNSRSTFNDTNPSNSNTGNNIHNNNLNPLYKSNNFNNFLTNKKEKISLNKISNENKRPNSGVKRKNGTNLSNLSGNSKNENMNLTVNVKNSDSSKTYQNSSTNPTSTILDKMLKFNFNYNNRDLLKKVMK